MGTLGRTKTKTWTRGVITIVAALSLLGSLAAPSSAYRRPGTTARVSSAPDGSPAHYPPPNLSADIQNLMDLSNDGRYISFSSHADNLVARDFNQMVDVFVRDLKAGRTQLVSKASDGSQALPREHSKSSSSISATGRYVAFDSTAPNLVMGDTNLSQDVFIHDVRRKVTKRVSVNSGGEEGRFPSPGAHSFRPSISANGRYVTFSSRASDLVEDDTNGATDVFIHDGRRGTTVRVSVSSNGDQGNDHSGGTPPADTHDGPSISATGRYVLFTSYADNLVSQDLNDAPDVFRHDVRTGQTSLVSVATDGTQAFTSPPSTFGLTATMSGLRAISGDGRYATFATKAPLVPNDGNDSADVFVRDMHENRTERVSVSEWGGEIGTFPIGSGYGQVISRNGRYILFMSNAVGWSEGDTSSTDALAISDLDAFLHDRLTGSVEWVTIAPDGSESKGCNGGSDSTSWIGALDADGRYAAFTSCADNLVQGERSEDAYNVYVRDLGPQLGVGGLGGSPSKKGDDPPDDRICITDDVCIPPGAAVSSSDATDDLNDVLTEQGANLYGAALAYRPQYEDLFAAIELEHMPKVVPGVSPIFYGLRFKVEDKSYEVRATSLLGGTFGLFDCPDGLPTCTKVADVRGGYGTTGMRVVFSLPLAEIGLEKGGKLKDVTAFSGLGSYLSGATKVLDSVPIK